MPRLRPLIFAKWRERQEKEKLAAAEALAAMDAPSAPIDPTRARIIAASVVAAWLAVFGFYLLRHTHKRAKDLGVDTGKYVEMRDPKTGEMKRMPIMRLGAAAGAPTAPPAPDSSASEQ